MFNITNKVAQLCSTKMVDYEKLYKSEIINFHPLINTTTISIKMYDFVNFILENEIKIHQILRTYFPVIHDIIIICFFNNIVAKNVI